MACKVSVHSLQKVLGGSAAACLDSYCASSIICLSMLLWAWRLPVVVECFWIVSTLALLSSQLWTRWIPRNILQSFAMTCWHISGWYIESCWSLFAFVASSPMIEKSWATWTCFKVVFQIMSPHTDFNQPILYFCCWYIYREFIPADWRYSSRILSPVSTVKWRHAKFPWLAHAEYHTVLFSVYHKWSQPNKLLLSSTENDRKISQRWACMDHQPHN